MYTDLKQLGTLKTKAMAEFNKRQKELNALPAVDYNEAVNKTKWEYFHLIFKQEGEKVLASAAFREFFETNKEWLQPYAVFSCLRELTNARLPRVAHGSYDAAEIESSANRNLPITRTSPSTITSSSACICNCSPPPDTRVPTVSC